MDQLVWTPLTGHAMAISTLSHAARDLAHQLEGPLSRPLTSPEVDELYRILEDLFRAIIAATRMAREEARPDVFVATRTARPIGGSLLSLVATMNTEMEVSRSLGIAHAAPSETMTDVFDVAAALAGGRRWRGHHVLE